MSVVITGFDDTPDVSVSGDVIEVSLPADAVSVQVGLQGPAGVSGLSSLTDTTPIGSLTAVSDATFVLSGNADGTFMRRITIGATGRSLLGTANAATARATVGLPGLLQTGNVLIFGEPGTSASLRLWNEGMQIYEDLTPTAAGWFFGNSLFTEADITTSEGQFNGSGAGLTTLNASKLVTGTVPAARLPIASADTRGAVRVGSGLSIDGSGVLSTTAGGGLGTVTTVSVTTANGVSGTVANATSTPAITIALGDITPSKVNGVTVAAGTGNPALTVNGTTVVSGTNTGDQDLSAYAKTADVVAGYQPLDSDLTAIAVLSTATYGRSLLTQVDAAAARSTLGLGTLATQSGTFSGTSSGVNTGDQDLAPYAKTADVAAGYQPLDADLTAIAALSTASFGRSLLTQSSAAAVRSAVGVVTTVDVMTGAAIQSAIDAAGAAGGGEVRLRAGVYAVSAPIRLRTGVALRGEGIGATVLAAANAESGANQMPMIVAPPDFADTLHGDPPVVWPVVDAAGLILNQVTRSFLDLSSRREWYEWRPTDGSLDMEVVVRCDTTGGVILGVGGQHYAGEMSRQLTLWLNAGTFTLSLRDYSVQRTHPTPAVAGQSYRVRCRIDPDGTPRLWVNGVESAAAVSGTPQPYVFRWYHRLAIGAQPAGFPYQSSGESLISGRVSEIRLVHRFNTEVWTPQPTDIGTVVRLDANIRHLASYPADSDGPRDWSIRDLTVRPSPYGTGISLHNCQYFELSRVDVLGSEMALRTEKNCYLGVIRDCKFVGQYVTAMMGVNAGMFRLENSQLLGGYCQLAVESCFGLNVSGCWLRDPLNGGTMLFWWGEGCLGRIANSQIWNENAGSPRHVVYVRSGWLTLSATSLARFVTSSHPVLSADAGATVQIADQTQLVPSPGVAQTEILDANSRILFDGRLDTSVSLDFGVTPVYSKRFTFTTPIEVGQRIVMAASGANGDATEMDGFSCAARVTALNTVEAFVVANPGPVSGTYTFNLNVS